jgi:hypothetical protein
MTRNRPAEVRSRSSAFRVSPEQDEVQARSGHAVRVKLARNDDQHSGNRLRRPVENEQARGARAKTQTSQYAENSALDPGGEERGAFSESPSVRKSTEARAGGPRSRATSRHHTQQIIQLCNNSRAGRNFPPKGLCGEGNAARVRSSGCSKTPDGGGRELGGLRAKGLTGITQGSRHNDDSVVEQ